MGFYVTVIIALTVFHGLYFQEGMLKIKSLLPNQVSAYYVCDVPIIIQRRSSVFACIIIVTAKKREN